MVNIVVDAMDYVKRLEIIKDAMDTLQQERAYLEAEGLLDVDSVTRNQHYYALDKLRAERLKLYKEMVRQMHKVEERP